MDVFHCSIFVLGRHFGGNSNRCKAANALGDIYLGEERERENKTLMKKGRERWRGRARRGGSLRHERWSAVRRLELTFSECLEESKDATNKSSEPKTREQKHKKYRNKDVNERER